MLGIKKQNKKYIYFFTFFFILIILISVKLIGLSVVIPDGDGSGGEYDVGIPTLNPISPEIDSDGSIKLTWSLESPYTIVNYHVWQKKDASSWFQIKELGNVHSYTTICLENGIYQYKVIATAKINGALYGSGYSNIQSVQVILQESNIPTLNSITSPNTDGIVKLNWNEVIALYGGTIRGYKVYRYSTSEGWKNIGSTTFQTTEYIDNIESNGEYKYYITSLTMIGAGNTIESDLSNIQSVVVELFEEEEEEEVPPEDLPSNPSIIINNGAETTNSFEITLTLYCENAEQMRFQISDGYWTNLTSYKTTYTVTLFANDPDAPDYRVQVEFRNQHGSCPDKPFDDITYVEQQQDQEEQELVSEYDYTTVYILIAILIGIIGAGIFLRYRKRREERG